MTEEEGAGAEVEAWFTLQTQIQFYPDSIWISEDRIS